MTQPQKELDEGVQAELNGQLRVLAGLLDQHPEVTVTWFQPDGKKRVEITWLPPGRSAKLMLIGRS